MTSCMQAGATPSTAVVRLLLSPSEDRDFSVDTEDTVHQDSNTLFTCSASCGFQTAPLPLSAPLNNPA